jgi:hypothetical protein
MRCDADMQKPPEKPGECSDQAVGQSLCRCGRAPRRKAQRNCHLCHAEANRRYRASVKQQNEAFRRIEAGSGIKDNAM